MVKEKFIYWQENDFWIGYFEEYPEYRTQGLTLDELKENLKDIYNDIVSGKVENIKRVGVLDIA